MPKKSEENKKVVETKVVKTETCGVCGKIIEEIFGPFGAPSKKACPDKCPEYKPWTTAGRGWG